MAKQLNVNLAFTADTSQAKAQIRALQQTLNNLTTATSLPGATKITSDLVSAKSAAGQLKIALQQATNVQTGNLDLTKFNAQLQKGSKDLNYYSQQLAKLGPQGVQAFGELTQSIMSAEIPLQRTRGLLSEFATTLKNTLRWQLASSALMGISSAVSNAYNYAEKLNSSLNDIRIVSGLSAEEMDKFADRANKAAQALSTTTRSYTDAALIFYQQGLSDAEVEERTNATIKMANVTGEAVEDVSSYMTAVWNNFNKDGTESVEHFADVMTKLGADTAASTEEIAGGLEKFAGVCNTIGLSFDYATSAITTIVDRTRQSEDVVGTALKTIFSRVQGLKLGETLDDGTTLNQYSEALAKIGVGIKTLDGELRPMDDILDDIGKKWDDLNNAEKAAVAQKVAGIRQYNQFIALFDNWDYMKQNLETASNADGTLNEQAEIYAESWEGARKRVQAAAEDIYNDLVDDDFFISLNNGFADVLKVLNEFIENLGGLRTVLPMVASLMLVAFGPNISGVIDELIYRIQRANGTLAEQALETQKVAAARFEEMASQNIGTDTDQAQAKAIADRLSLQEQILSSTDLIGQERADQYVRELDLLKVYQDQTIELKKQADNAKDTAENSKERIIGKIYENAETDISQEQDEQLNTIFSNTDFQIEKAFEADNAVGATVDEFDSKIKELDDEKANLLKIKKEEAIKNNDTTFDEQAYEIQLNQQYGRKKTSARGEMLKALQSIGTENGQYLTQGAQEALAKDWKGATGEEIAEFWRVQSKNGYIKNSSIGKVKNDFQNSLQTNGFEISEKETNNYVNKQVVAQEKINQAENSQIQTNKQIAELKEKIANDVKKGNIAIQSTGQIIIGISTGLTSMASAISSAVGLVKTLEDDTASTSEKILTTLTIAPMVLSQFAMGITQISSVVKAAQTSLIAYNAIISTGNKIEGQSIIIKGLAKIQQIGINIIQKLAIALKKEDLVVTEALTGANAGLLASLLPFLAVLTPIALALGVVAAAFYVNYKNTHEARKALERANEELTTAKENYDNLKSSIDEVNSSLSSLNDKYDSLQELTFGTAEWQSKLYEVNNEIQDIIDKYGLLEGKHFYRDAEGVLHITEAGREVVEDKNKRDLRNSQYAVAAAEGTVERAESAALRESVLYDSKYKATTSTTETKASDQVNKAKYGGNKNVQAQTDDTENTSSNKDSDHAFRSKTYRQQTTNKYTSKISLSADQLDGAVTALSKSVEQGTSPTDWSDASQLIAAGVDQKTADLIASNTDLQSAVKELTIATDSNTEAYAQKLANVLAGDDRYTEKAKDIDKEYQAGVLDNFSTDVAKYVEANYKNVEINDEIKKAYANASNYAFQDGKFYSKDEQGNAILDEEISVNNDVLQKYQAQQDAINECTKSFDKYKESVEESKKVWAAADKIKKVYTENKKSINNLQKAQEDYDDALKNGNDEQKKAAKEKLDEARKSNSKYIKAVKDNAAELLNISKETAEKVFTDDFIGENATLIEDAINGDVEALDELGERTFIAEISAEFKDEEAKAEAEELARTIADFSDNHITIGASADFSEVESAMTQLANKAGWTADEAEKKFAKMGYDTEVTAEPIMETVTSGAFIVDEDSLQPGGVLTSEPKWWTSTNKLAKGTALAVKVKSHDGTTSYGGNVTNRNTNTGDNSNVDTTGGSGSKKTSSAKKVDKKVVRYHNIDDTLDDINQKLEKAANLEDRLFGKARIAQMEKQIKAYKEEANALEKRNKIAKNYLKYDKNQAAKSINKFNKLTGAKVENVKYDADNDILNYNAILSAAKKAADKWYKKAKANPEDDAIQDKYDKIKEYYEDIEEKLKQVEETRDEIVENEEKRLEALRNAQDKFFDELTYKIEVRLDINERDLELLERSYDKIADLTYKRVEAINILFKTEKDATGNDVLSSESRFGVAAKQLGIYTDEYDQLKDAYAAGNISQEQFVEGLEEVYDGALSAADSLQDLDEQMLEYYSDTLASGQEELDKYAERIDNVVSSLNHYLNVMDLIGKNKSYEQINKITNTLTKTAKNQYNTATQTYKMYLNQQAQAKKAMDDYLKEHTKLTTYEKQMNDAGYQALLKNYDAITEYVNESYEEQLSSAEEYLEALNTEYTNFFDQLKNKYLDTLSSTMDFDRLNNSLQNVKTQWDEVLTPVNQAYELTKLVRQAEQDMAATDSAYAKQQYKNYIDSTKALENKTELSNYELEIQQAKYKQLQAQIALEEAQNAKNMVRLSRDSEGNYGYVYTADQDSIADAQQAKDDADNDLYNIALRGRDEYYEKLLQLESDYQDAIAEAGETYKGDTEKLNAALAQIEEEYYDLRQTYLYNYNLAAITDDRAKRDAYIADYEDIIKKDDEWKATSTKNINAIKEKQQEYKKSTEEVYNALGLSVSSFASTINDLDTKQQNLTDTVQQKTIPALTSEETQVLKNANAYANYRDRVQETIEKLEKLAQTADTTISQVGGYTEEGEEDSNYNTFINNLAIKKGLYTATDSKDIVHFSKTDQATADKYAKNADITPETEKWNNNVAENAMNKSGWFAYDSSGKMHYTTITNKKKAKAYLAKLMGVSTSDFTMNKFGSFDTGGYTGEWGTSGKLAMLHQKELVLNADDTKNFLAGINILRDVVKSIDLQAMCASNSGMRAAGVSTSNQTLAQEVNITAEFPNATDHNEIEQAFDTLINRAAQYVNRK